MCVIKYCLSDGQSISPLTLVCVLTAQARQYMQMLPKEKQPVAGSEGAQYRKKQLAKQLPAHDQDPAKCHELSPKEVKEMEQFVKKYKSEALGVGDVKLPHEVDAHDPNRVYMPGGDRSTTAAEGAIEEKATENKRPQYVSRVVTLLAHLVYCTDSCPFFEPFSEPSSVSRRVWIREVN